MQTSFEKHFGELKPDQIWDFSSYNLNRLGLESGFNNRTATRAAWGDNTPKIADGVAITYPEKYVVPDELHNWIDKNLREEVYNKKRGTTNFTLKMPDDRDIVIIPIYQGQAGLNYNLCIKSEDDTPSFEAGYIWEKSIGIEWKNNEEEVWHDFYYKDEQTQETKLDQSFTAHTVGRDVRANPVRVLHTKAQGTFSLYLDNLNLDKAWDGQNGKPFGETFSDQKQSSSKDGQMVAISLNNSPETFKAVSDALKAAFNDPENPTDGKYTYQNFMLLGCEDSNMMRNIAGDNDPRLIGTDWDMNDLIFLIVGITIDDIKTTKDEIISKRYMVEDLGSDYDYDFNDIVFDVTQIKHTDENGEVTITQWLELQHLCGTIPWRVKVGDYTSPIFPGRNDYRNGDNLKGYDPHSGKDNPADPYYNLVGYNGSEERRGIMKINITGWNPDMNNVVMTAWPGAAGQDISEGESDWTDDQKTNYLKEVDGTSYEFPEVGKYPFIIACDISQQPNDEHEYLPKEAIVVWKKPGYETIVTPVDPVDPDDPDQPEPIIDDDGYNSIQVELPNPAEDGSISADVDVTFDSWADDIIINPQYLQGIKPGYTIKATFDITNPNEKHLMFMKVEAPWEKLGEGFNISDDQTTLEIEVSPGNEDLLKTYGIALKGINVHISKLEIIPGEWDGYTGIKSLPWSNSDGKNLTYYEDENKLFIRPVAFENVKAGDKLIVVRENNNQALQIKFQETHEMLGKESRNEDPCVRYLSEEDVQNLKTYGVYIQGDNVKIYNVSVVTPTYATITVNSNNSSLGTVTGGGRFETGNKVTIKATANDGNRFVKWNDGNTNAEREITVTEDATYTAEFEVIPTPTITFNTIGTGTGSISAATGTYREGTTLNVTATASDGSRFVKWENGETNPSRTISVGAQDATYTAEFELIPTPTITFATSGDGSGAITGSTTGNYREGTTINVTATPETGSHFVKWENGDTNASRTIVVGTEDATYTAQFDLNTYTVIVNATAGGTVTGGKQYKYGETAHLTANPEDGYKFVSWNDGNTNAKRDVEVTADVTYTAKFVAEGAVLLWSGSITNNNYSEVVFNTFPYSSATIMFTGNSATNVKLISSWSQEAASFDVSSGSSATAIVTNKDGQSGYRLSVPNDVTVTAIYGFE